MARVTDEPTLVLLTRPFRNSSLTLDLLTLHHGRIAAVRRGARSSSGNRLQPFTQFLAGWYGKGQMVTLIAEDNLRNFWLSGNRSASAYYVVELITRLVKEHEPVPKTFVAACACINQIEAGTAPAQALRPFEQSLLAELGYAADLGHDAHTGAVLDPTQSYLVDPQLGVVAARAENLAGQQQPLIVQGDSLLAIAQQDFSDARVCVAARKVFQAALEPLLEGRPLVSKQLLQDSPKSVPR